MPSKKPGMSSYLHSPAMLVSHHLIPINCPKACKTNPLLSLLFCSFKNSSVSRSSDMYQKLSRERRRLSNFPLLVVSVLIGIMSNLPVSSSDCRDDFSLFRCPTQSA